MAHHATRGADAASRFEPRRFCSGPDPRHPLIDRPGSLRSALHLSPLSNGRKRRHETLLDFDAPDARGDRGAAGPSNQKITKIYLLFQKLGYDADGDLLRALRWNPGFSGRKKSRETKRQLSH